MNAHGSAEVLHTAATYEKRRKLQQTLNDGYIPTSDEYAITKRREI